MLTITASRDDNKTETRLEGLVKVRILVTTGGDLVVMGAMNNGVDIEMAGIDQLKVEESGR